VPRSKRPQTSRRTTVGTRGNSKNELPSFYDGLPQNKSSRVATSRRNKDNQDKLDTDTFESYMEYVLQSFFLVCLLVFFVFTGIFGSALMKTKSAYAYFDSLWFNMYYKGHNKSNVLKWIKAKRIFSRKYVFVPMVCW
jgi:hypothetical protein